MTFSTNLLHTHMYVTILFCLLLSIAWTSTQLSLPITGFKIYSPLTHESSKEPHDSNSMLCYISFAPLLPSFQNQRPSHSFLGDEKLGQEELMAHSCTNTASFWRRWYINKNNILLTTGYEVSYWHYATFSANRVFVLCKIFVQKSYK